MNLYENELNVYRQLNKVARQNGVVLFGSSFAKNIPVNELKQDFELECDLYNRSLTDLSVFDAEAVLKDCVLDLTPEKLLLQLGETDLERGIRTVPEIVSAYEALLGKIRSLNKKCHITIISVCETEPALYPAELNAKLQELARRTGCQYADLEPALSNEAPGVKAFCLLNRFFRDRITEYRALHMRLA